MAPSPAPGNAEPRTEATILAAEAYWLLAPGQGEIRTETLPELGPGDAQVRTLYSGISRGTETTNYRGQTAGFRKRRNPGALARAYRGAILTLKTTLQEA